MSFVVKPPRASPGIEYRCADYDNSQIAKIPPAFCIFQFPLINNHSRLRSSPALFVPSVSFVVKPPRASPRIEYRCAEYEYHFVEYEYDRLPLFVLFV